MVRIHSPRPFFQYFQFLCFCRFFPTTLGSGSRPSDPPLRMAPTLGKSIVARLLGPLRQKFLRPTESVAIAADNSEELKVQVLTDWTALLRHPGN